MSDILVTGGAGYIGSELVPLLVRRGHHVRVVDDFSLSSPRNLPGAPEFEFVRGDVRDPEVVERAVTGADAVVHLAAITGADETHDIPEKTHDVNARGTEVVARAAAEAGVERFVMASSCNVYGATRETGIAEDDDPAPSNPYAQSKLEAERVVQTADVDAVLVRMATNYGYSPGVRFNLVVNSFVFRAAVGEPLTVYGDGSNWRPFIHVRDSARAFAEALDWPTGVYNVGEANYRLDDVAAAVAGAFDREVEVTHLDDRDPGPSYNVRFDRMTDVGFTPEHNLEDGIRDLAEGFRWQRATQSA